MNKLTRIITVAFALLLATTLSFAAEKKETPTAPAAVEKKAAPAAMAELIDINTATKAELKTIPGIGDAYAKKIIAGRPYAKKEQLKTKKILPPGLYEMNADVITAKQAKK